MDESELIAGRMYQVMQDGSPVRARYTGFSWDSGPHGCWVFEADDKTTIRVDVQVSCYSDEIEPS